MTELPALALPAADIAVRAADNGPEVYDALRRKWVALTPEEWVRQNFTAFLVAHRGYPAGLLANEVGLRLNGTLKRCDGLVYDRRLRPLVVMEYKAPHVAITQKVFDQIARYNIVVGAPYLIVSNGMRHYCCRLGSGGYSFLPDIPRYDEMV